MSVTVVIVGRDPEKSAATVVQVKELSGNPNVDFLLADLSSQATACQLAQQFK